MKRSNELYLGFGNHALRRSLAAAVILLIITGCNNTKYLGDNERLLTDNNIKLRITEKYGKKREIKQQLAALARQKPNKGLFRMKVGIYNWAGNRRLTRLTNWLRLKVGEAPVIFSEEETGRTEDLLQNYFFSKGYFHTQVSSAVKGSSRKARVTYLVNTGDVYRIDSVFWPDSGTHINNELLQYRDESLLSRGTPYMLEVLREERNRITSLIRNAGYYYFSQEYVFFRLDSSYTRKTVNVYVEIQNPPGQNAHLTYYLNSVYIFPDYQKEKTETDSIFHENCIFVTSRLRFRKEVLLNVIFLRKGDRYSQDNYDRTLSRLIDLGIFRFVNVKFKPAGAEKPRHLDCYIYLSPSRKNELSIEGQLNTNTTTSQTTSYPLGTAMNLSFLTRNVLRNADRLSLNLQGAAEVQFGGEELINTIDITPHAELFIPRFLLPLWLTGVSRNFGPKTRLSLSYNLLQRKGKESYAINLTNISFLYDWNESFQKRYIVAPLVVSLVELNQNRTSQDFRDRLDNEPVLRNRFEEQFIIGSNASFIFNNQQFGTPKDYVFFRFNLDLSGTTLYMINKLTGSSLGGISYSQYLRTDFDLRYYRVMNENASIIYRFTSGAGIPWGNSEVLPYVKQFYIGGANSVRAWSIRDLGPGSYSDTTGGFPDKTGDIRMEGNIEYRFGIFDLLKGALFVDAGNMWTFSEDTTRPGAVITGDFYRELAVGAGVGLRMDFTYFIIRFDLAMPVLDPAYPADDRWRLNNVNLKDNAWRRDNLLLNLAIGYPF